MGQTLGPKRVVASGAPWPLIVAASAVLVLAAFTVRWGWTNSLPQQQEQQQDATQATDQVQSGPPQALNPSPGAAYEAPRADRAEASMASPPVQEAESTAPPPKAPEPVALTRSSRSPGARATPAQAPVPTLFLDPVLEDAEAPQPRARHDRIVQGHAAAALGRHRSLAACSRCRDPECPGALMPLVVRAVRTLASSSRPWLWRSGQRPRPCGQERSSCCSAARAGCRLPRLSRRLSAAQPDHLQAAGWPPRSCGSPLKWPRPRWRWRRPHPAPC